MQRFSIFQRLRHRVIPGVVLLGLLIAAAVGFHWQSRQNSSSLSIADAPHQGRSFVPAEAALSGPPSSLSRPPRAPKTRTSPPPMAAPGLLSEETWDFERGGQPLSLALAMDEALLRDAEGKDRIIPLAPPATWETLPARLAALSAPGGVFPVGYLVGEARTTASRRMVTPDLRVQLDPATAENTARQNALVIKDRPSYAPGWVIMTAADSFAALDAMVNLRTDRRVVSADVLLAKQQSRRALPNDPLAGNQWHLKRSGAAVAGSDVNIESIWNYPAASGSRGAGIRIGVVDDGLQTDHPDLAPNVDIVNGKDWNGNDNDPNPGTGDDHGTACAGNAAARGNNGIGVTGTAPLATLVGMRLIAGAASDQDEAEAMSWLPQLIQIKSNSWGPNDTGTVLEGPQALTMAALQTAATTGRGGKGSIILWAGGNGGTANDNSNYDGYANSIYTIAIGATDSAGRRADYSEPGSNLVVCAPSNGAAGTLGITTLDRTGSVGYNTASSAAGGDYTNDFGGTSSATPTAAGIVALMLEKNPGLGWRDVQEVLIRSAVKPPAVASGWVTNAAGIPFNENFGAGLINATAAVNLAASWTNLTAQTSVTSSQAGLNAAIPNNNAAGLTRTFDLSSTSLRVEHVTLKTSVTHTARGNLEITLTSPAGMTSRLAGVRPDSGDDYSNWTFSSVRNWGESSTGTWTLKIADLSNTGNSTGGIMTDAELKIFGTPGTLVNPAPVVLITQPADATILSPGTPVTVNVAVTDVTVYGSPGTVSQVQLFDNNVLRGTRTTPPWTFTFSLTPGNHALTATATDSEGAMGTSVSVSLSVINQPPIIAAATLSALGQSYSDTPLTVAFVDASDPEGVPLTYTWQWQSSVNQTLFADEPGATTATAPALPGKLLRCVVTAWDGFSSSGPFTTAAVNLLGRPVTAVEPSAGYSYTSGLVLRGTDSPLSRRAIIHEFSQGPVGSTSEWIEILTLQTGSLAYWDLSDAAGNLLVFRDSPVWDNIPAGTLIVVYNGASRDPLLPADDLDPSDRRMVVGSTNGSWFDSTFDSWLPLGNSGDSIFLNDDTHNVVHSLSYGNSTSATPNIGSVGSGWSAYYAGDSDSGADQAANWRPTTALTARRGGPRAGADLPVVFGGPWTLLPSGFTGTGLGPPYAASLGGDTAAGSAKFDDSNDSLTIEFSAAAAVLTYQIGGNPASATATSGIFLVRESADGITYRTLRTITNASNADTAYTDTPAATTRFIRFLYQTKTSGNIQLDKLFIGAAAATTLNFSVSPATFAENLGASAATGTVSIASPAAATLTVSMTSSDTSEATLAVTTTITAGQTSSPAFAITAVDDPDPDGPQLVTLTASAPGYVSGSAVVTVTDNEPAVEGVTPAAANNPASAGFVAALRNGSLNRPALFRIGVGALIPAGLNLDPATGLLNGTIAATAAPGNYPIVIERYNTLGETVSQSWTLTLGTVPGQTFAQWISSWPEAGARSGFNDDPDGDGLPNGIENLLGSLPTVPDSPGLTLVSATTTTLVFRHPRSNSPATDLTATYQWSTNLASWHLSGTTAGGTGVVIVPATLLDNSAPANDLIEVTATIAAGAPRNLFIRVKATRP